MKKRGQAATEYLYVYGWAIFTIMVVIGILVQFDFFNISNFRTESCNTGNQIICLEAQLTTTGNLTVRLQNNHPIDIRIINITSYLFEEISHEINQTLPRSERGIYSFQVSNAELGRNEGISVDVEISFSRDEPGANVYSTRGNVWQKVVLD